MPPTPLRLIIAADLQADAVMLERALQHAGFAPQWERISDAASYRARLDASLDLILTDFTLFQFDAVQALELLHASGLDIPLIVVSGPMTEENANVCLRLGAADCVQKDQLLRLGAAVERALTLRKLSHSARDALRALRESEARFRAVFDHAQDGIVIADDAARYLEANAAAGVLFGLPSEALIGRSIHEFAPPGQGAAVREAWQRFLAEGQASGDFRIYRPDGSFRDVEFRARANILPGQHLSILRDMTERRRAEEAVLQLAAIVESSGDAILRTALDGTVTSWNPAAERLFGYTASEMVGRSCDVLVPPESAAQVNGLLDQVRTQERAVTFETVLKRKDGRFVEVSVSLSPVRDRNGAVVGVARIARDISERVRAERALRAREEQYRRIVETAQEGIWVLDAAGRTTFVNQRMAAMLGAAPHELVGARLLDYLSSQEEWARAAAALDSQPGDAIRQRDVRLRRKDGHEIWVMLSASAFSDSAGAFAGRLLMVTDITARKRAEAALLRHAFYDQLTGLPNRSLLLDRLQQAILAAAREFTQPALILVGLDQFKAINDTLGHVAGDAVLREVGTRLRQAVRGSDTVARVGGDEYAVILPETADLEAVLMVARRLRQVLAEPVQVDRLSLQISASVGVVRYPDHGADAEILLRRADVAMFLAKRGGDGIAVYVAEQDQNSPDRLSLLADLRHAVDQGQLHLHYQPQVDLPSGRVTGVEALARWDHPARGAVPPAVFIPLAEQAGLMHQLTDWALNAALRQCAAWQAAGLPLRVSVNLSVRNLQDPRLPARLAGMLARWAVRPSLLQLEITESSLMADAALALAVVTNIHALGIPLAIDDFGTGYSSLSYLQRLPVDEIKIDRSFVADMTARASNGVIVRSTIELAHNLGLRVVAEGVESAEVYERLAALGCDAAQGYWISRPLPPEEVARWARSRLPDQ